MSHLKKFKSNLNFFILVCIPIFYIIGNLFTNLIVLIAILNLVIFYRSKLFDVYENNKYLFFLIIIFVFLNSLTSDYKYFSFLKFSTFLRFLLFPLCIYLLISNLEKKRKNLFFKLFVFIILFVIIDILIQFSLGKDLFGFKYNYNYFRLSGPFGDEYIVGFYIFYFGIVSIAYLNELKVKKIYLFISMFVVSISVLLTGERTSFFSSILFILIFFLVSPKLWRYTLILFFSVITTFFIIIDTSDKLSQKYSFNRMYNYQKSFDDKKNLKIKKLAEISKIQDKTETIKKDLVTIYENNLWFAHFRGGISIFKDNIIFGSGFKTFRNSCRNYEDFKSVVCTTHPHNIYIEILSDLGLIGIIIFCSLIIYLNKIFFQKKGKNNFSRSLVFSLLLIFLFPLKTHGSLFTTNYAFVLAFLIGNYFYFHYLKEKG